MNKGIHDLMQLSGIGGLISVVGGALGKAAGDAAANPCNNSCLNHFVSADYQSCVSACPDPWLYAVYGAIPGVIIGVIWYLVQKKNQEVTF